MCHRVCCIFGVLFCLNFVKCLDLSKELRDLSVGIIRRVPKEECLLVVEKYDEISVMFTGRFLKDNKTFASNVGESPFSFRVETQVVIPGWDKGVLG